MLTIFFLIQIYNIEIYFLCGFIFVFLQLTFCLPFRMTYQIENSFRVVIDLIYQIVLNSGQDLSLLVVKPATGFVKVFNTERHSLFASSRGYTEITSDIICVDRFLGQGFMKVGECWRKFFRIVRITT